MSDDLPLPYLLSANGATDHVTLRHADDHRHDAIDDDDDDQATDGEDMDMVDEEVDPALLGHPSSTRDASRELLVQSHLELAPEDRLHSEAERRVARSMHVAGTRHSAPPSLFTTSKDLQDLGLVPFDERVEDHGRDEWKVRKMPRCLRLSASSSSLSILFIIIIFSFSHLSFPFSFLFSFSCPSSLVLPKT